MKRKMDSIASVTSSQRSSKAEEGKVDDKAEESHQLCSYFANLPSDLTAHILLQLPIKSLLICRCVCKNWNTLISEPNFAKLHFEQAADCLMIRLEDPTPVSTTLHLLEIEFGRSKNYVKKLDPIFKLPLRGGVKSFVAKTEEIEKKSKGPPYQFIISNSCNGLLCLCHPFTRNPLVICNPVTGEFIKLPKTTPIRFNKSEVKIEIETGFGFQPKTNEYKVIKIRTRHVLDFDSDFCEFQRVTLEVHTLGTPSWRNVEVDQFSISRLMYPTCVNGALHWIRCASGYYWQQSILCFNFESERLQSFPSPRGVFKRNNENGVLGKYHITMGQLEGFLYICDASSFQDVKLWIMKNYGIGESWTKAYHIDTLGLGMGSLGSLVRPCYCFPVKQYEEEGVGILLYFYEESNCFVYYQPEKHRYKVFRIHRNRSDSFVLMEHMPSLISLKDVVKGDGVKVLNIHSRCASFKLHEEEEVISMVYEE